MMARFSKETGQLSEINRCNSIPAPEQVKFEKEIERRETDKKDETNKPKDRTDLTGRHKLEILINSRAQAN